MKFKPLPNTDISPSVRFSFAKFMINVLFILARSFHFLGLRDCLKVLDFKWHVRDLILSFTRRLIPFNGMFFFFLYKAWTAQAISLFRIYGGSEKTRFVFGVSYIVLMQQLYSNFLKFREIHPCPLNTSILVLIVHLHLKP